MYWVLLLLEFILLFFTAQTVSRSLFLIFYRVFKSHAVAIRFLAFVFLPGVIIHELSHFLVAEVLQVRTGEIEFVPKVEGQSVKLGSVQVAQTDFIRRFFIGVAPILVGTTVLVAVMWLVSFSFSGEYVLVIYSVFVIANTMFSSSKDLEGAAVFIGVLLFTAIVLFFAFPHFYPGVWTTMQSPNVVGIAARLMWILLIPVTINVVISLLLSTIAKR